MTFCPEPTFLRQLLDLTNNTVDQRTALDRLKEAVSGRLASYSGETATDVAPSRPPGRDEDRWPYVRREAWATQLANSGAKINSSNWAYWLRVSEQYGLPKVISAVLYLPVDKRWPDRTEIELSRQPVMAPPEEDPATKSALVVISAMGWEAARDKLGICVGTEQQLLNAVRSNTALARKLI